jgi:hypothetical protein
MAMSEDISVGVQILLKRFETNPEEMTNEYGKWAQLREAVLNYMEGQKGVRYLYGLNHEEIEMLFRAFTAQYRKKFDDWVMKEVLNPDDEDSVMTQHKLAHSMAANKVLINNPQMLQNSIPPGSWQNVATQTSNTSVVSQQSLVARLKQELGIK